MVSCWSRRKLVPFMFCERLRLILEIANRICQAVSRFLIGPPVTLLRPRPCFQFSLFVHPAAGRRLTLSRALPSRQGSVSSVQCLYCSRQILSWTADSSRFQQQVGHSPVPHTRHHVVCNYPENTRCIHGYIRSIQNIKIPATDACNLTINQGTKPPSCGTMSAETQLYTRPGSAARR